MKDLLPHFEDELSRLQASVRQFADSYPKIAGRLLLGADVAEDPHVERLIQSFALLAARVHKRLDDDFPLVTESLLNVLYPHYLRPFPSCSVARFSVGPGGTLPVGTTLLDRGTALKSNDVRGVACEFRTAYPVAFVPVALKSVRLSDSVNPPTGTTLPQGVTSTISFELQLTSTDANWGQVGESLRFYLDGEPSTVSALREALLGNVAALMVQSAPGQRWLGPCDERPLLVGLEDDQSLIDYDERSHPAYRLLTEYFAFPEKFNFIDIPLPRLLRNIGRTRADSTASLHFVLTRTQGDSANARSLKEVSASNFVSGCTPIVNLFTRAVSPINLTHTVSEYPLVIDGRDASGFEVHSVDRVDCISPAATGEAVDRCEPFFGIRHHEGATDRVSRTNGETVTGSSSRYWHLRQDDSDDDIRPGYKAMLAIVDSNFKPSKLQVGRLSILVTASNRDLPSLLPARSKDGDLWLAAGDGQQRFPMLLKPTRRYRLSRRDGNLWRLISHLSLNHLSLSGRSAEALREMLRLYDLPNSAANRQQIDAISSVSFAPATAWLAGKPFATFVRGTDISLFVDEDAFVGTGLRLFVSMLDRFFSLYVHINSFTRLIVFSCRSQQLLIECQARNGATAMV